MGQTFSSIHNGNNGPFSSNIEVEFQNDQCKNKFVKSLFSFFEIVLFVCAGRQPDCRGDNLNFI